MLLSTCYLADVQIDRQDLVLELNISYRDVRILDPLVSDMGCCRGRRCLSLTSYCATPTSRCCAQVAEPYPTALLIRERALIVNMESVRMIICKDQCFVSICSHVSETQMLWHEMPATCGCERCACSCWRKAPPRKLLSCRC